MEAARPSHLVRFGVFELDLRAGELRKNNLRVNLQGQPVQILALLLERPGELVTREELQKKLWPNDTIVEFDHSINAAIKRLREALGDSADNPRFIETLARRGYRFIAPVDGFEGDARARRAVPLQATWRRRALAGGGASIFLGVAFALLLTRPVPPPKVLGSVQITSDGRSKGRFWLSGLSTDGSRLYFSEEVAGHMIVSQVSAAGGETAPVPTPFENALLSDVSPDASELLISSLLGNGPEGPLWILPVPVGSPHRLGNAIGYNPTWSPNGKTIVYANGPDLYLTKSDGTESRKLLTVRGMAIWPRWSPDGKLLRFTVYDSKSNSSSLWEVSPNGANLHPLLPGWNNPPAECCSNWTPDGKYFVFESSRNGRTDIWAIREKGGFFHKSGREPIQLTTGPLDFHQPLASRDSKKLFALGEMPRGELVRYDSKSGDFVPYLSGLSAMMLDFSRDGEWVAYTTYPDGTLWRSRLDGSLRLQLAAPVMCPQLPHWSPDGKQIAFAATARGKPRHLFLISADGGNLQQLTTGDQYEVDPNWSPDGNLLVFSGFPVLEGGASAATAIHLLDLRTHRVSTLPGSEGLYSPRWSPDGRYIAALRSGPENLMLFDLTTQKWVELADLNVNWPSWSRDGRYIYFNTLPGGDMAIFRVRISSHKLERVVNLKGLRLGWGEWAGLAPDDSPLVVRDIGTWEIYALDWEAP